LPGQFRRQKAGRGDFTAVESLKPPDLLGFETGEISLYPVDSYSPFRCFIVNIVALFQPYVNLTGFEVPLATASNKIYNKRSQQNRFFLQALCEAGLRPAF
jgi:hypothetical protein